MKRIIIRLPRHVKRRFQRSLKKIKEADLRDRYRIVLLYDEGLGCNAIAARIGCAPATAVRVANRFLELGEEGLEDQRKENGTPKVDADLLEALVILLNKLPQDYGYARSTWTQELLSLVLERLTRVRVSPRTVGRMLGKLNARWGRPRPVVRSPMPETEKKRRIRRVERMLRKIGPREVAYFVDEVDIHLNPRIGPDWMLRGSQKEAVTPGRNEKRYVCGALNAKTGEIVWVSAERKNSDLLISLLFRLRKLHPRAKRIHLILDNYSIHTSKKTDLAIRGFRKVFVRYFLPCYSPEYNRIERLWKQLHDNVTRNHRCRTIEDLMKDVELFLKRASPFPGSKPSLARLPAARKSRRSRKKAS